jgi:hypothetical protein
VRPCGQCTRPARFMVSIGHQLRNARLACAQHLPGAVQEMVEADNRERPANVRVL